MGIHPTTIAQLSNAIQAEAQRIKGAEMVFQIVTFAQEWLATTVKPGVKVVGSLASQMRMRASAEALVRLACSLSVSAAT